MRYWIFVMHRLVYIMHITINRAIHFKSIGKDGLDINISQIHGIVDEYEDVLKSYQDQMDMTDRRINKLTEGLQTRIDMLEKYIVHHQQECVSQYHETEEVSIEEDDDLML